MSSSPSQRSRTALGIGIVVVLAVVVVGSFIVFGGGGDDGGDTVPATTAPPVVDPNAPPELRNTGEDWDTIVRSIVSYRHWLFTHPDPALLASIRGAQLRAVSPTVSWDSRTWRPRAGVTTRRVNALTVELVQLRERVADNVAILFIRFGPTPAIRVVDRAGEVIQDSPGIPAGALALDAGARTGNRCSLATVQGDALHGPGRPVMRTRHVPTGADAS